MKLNERHLIQLAAVLDAGGVSEGAAMLGMTQPAVSRSLAMLEARVGQPLFAKGRRPLQPTVLGRQLATHGRTIRVASRKASEMVESYLQGSTGLVRVGGVPFFMDAVISRMIAEFQLAEPEIAVQQSYGHLADLTAALEGDQIDLAIAPLAAPQSLRGFEFVEILPGRNIVASRTGHPLLRKRRLAASDLADFPWVAPLPGSPLMTDVHAILLTIGMSELNIRYSGGSLMSVVNHMEASNALTVLPHSVVFALRKENRVTVLPIEIPQANRSLGILRRAAAPRPKASDGFAAFIVGAFEDLRHLIKRHENAVVWGR